LRVLLADEEPPSFVEDREDRRHVGVQRRVGVDDRFDERADVSEGKLALLLGGKIPRTLLRIHRRGRILLKRR
jgi:hypothetical protein